MAQQLSILILGGGLQGLSVARSLKEAGYRTVCLCGVDSAAVRRCRFIDCFVDAEHNSDEHGYDVYLCNIITQYECKVAVPMSDKLADFLSRNKADIESRTGCRCAVAPYETFSIAASKGRLLDFCAKHGFPHPRTASVNGHNVDEVAAYVGFPALIKPNHSVGSRGITKVENLEQLKAKLSAVIAQYGDCTLQRYLPQNGRPYYNVMQYRVHDGSVPYTVTQEIRRYYPVGGGSSSYSVTVDIPELTELCTRVLEALEWEGAADFDILQDENGGFNIIEINPRVPASLRSSAASGVNFPQLMVKDMLFEPLPTFTYRTGMGLRYLGLDLMWFLSSPKRFSAKPSWFKFFGKDICYQEGGWKDRGAMMAFFFEGIRKALDPTARKQKKGL